MFGPDYWLSLAAGLAAFAAIILVVGLLAVWCETHLGGDVRDWDVDEFLGEGK